MFNECRSLKVIDLSKWKTTSWELANLQSLVAACHQLETLYLPTDFTQTTFKVTNTNYQVTYVSTTTCLRNTNGYPIAVNTNWTGFYCLSRDSLLAIIDYLPMVSSAKTLTLGVCHKDKLTAAEIAVATGKGWTVA